MRRSNLSEPVRQSLVRYPPPYDAHYGVVPLPPPSDPVPIAGVEAALQSATKAMGMADEIARALPQHFMLSRILLRQEAVSSSGIEGTNATLDELLAVEETADDEARSEAKQVRDYAVALELAIVDVERRRHEAFTIEQILSLHKSLMQADPTYKGTPGKLRDKVLWIGPLGRHISESTFNPPPPDRVRECLNDSLRYMRCERDEHLCQHLVTRMAISHAHFESVHPFPDGNGRVGRLLLPLMMAADGATPLYVSPFLRANTPGYYQALKDAQQRLEYRPLISVLSTAIESAVSTARETRTMLEDLAERWRKHRAFRAKSTAERALDHLLAHPIVNAGRLAERMSVSFSAANRALDQLSEVGIVTPRNSDRRNRLFVASDVLRIWNRPM